MMKSVLIIVFVLLCFTLSANEGWACSCKPKSDVEIAFKESDAVLTGAVTKIQPWYRHPETRQWFSTPQEGHSKNWPHNIQVEVAVDESFKGPHQNKIIIETSGNGAACGYSFSLGESYLIYSYYWPSEINKEKKLHVSLCGRTKLANNAVEEIQNLRVIAEQK